MQTESLRNIRPSWIAFGWFIAAAVASLVIFAFIAVGILDADTAQAGEVWVALSLMIGFVAGGFFAGWRAGAAPVLHGLGIGIFSLVVWFLANLIPGEATGWTAWRAIPTVTAVGLLILQTVSAIIGARLGLRLTHEPVFPAD